MKILIFVMIFSLFVPVVSANTATYKWETRPYQVKLQRIQNDKVREKVQDEYYVYFGTPETKKHEDYLASVQFVFKYIAVKDKDEGWQSYLFHSQYGIAGPWDPFSDELWDATPEHLKKTIDLLKDDERVVLVSLNLVTSTLNVWLQPRYNRNRFMHHYYAKKLNRLGLKMLGVKIKKEGKIA